MTLRARGRYVVARARAVASGGGARRRGDRRRSPRSAIAPRPARRRSRCRRGCGRRSRAGRRSRSCSRATRRGRSGPGAILVPEPGAPAAPAIHTGAAAVPGGGAAHAARRRARRSARPRARSSSPCRARRTRAGCARCFDPILRGDADLVAPSYARRRFDGVLVTGLVYPLTRALFGQRLPPAARAGDRPVAAPRGAPRPATTSGAPIPRHAGADLWVITQGARARVPLRAGVPRAAPGPAAAAARRLRRPRAACSGRCSTRWTLHASRWQRVRGSCPVATFGDEHLPGRRRPPARAGAARRHLRASAPRTSAALWGPVLPPQALYALQRIPREPPEGFRDARTASGRASSTTSRWAGT